MPMNVGDVIEIEKPKAPYRTRKTRQRLILKSVMEQNFQEYVVDFEMLPDIPPPGFDKE